MVSRSVKACCSNKWYGKGRGTAGVAVRLDIATALRVQTLCRLINKLITRGGDQAPTLINSS